MRKGVVLLIGALLTVVFIGTAAAATTWTVDAPVTVKESTDGFTISAGWQYEGKRIDEPYLFDVTVVRLDDGRYRLYGEASDIVTIPL